MKLFFHLNEMVVKHVFVKLVNINVISNVEIVLHVKIMEIIG